MSNLLQSSSKIFLEVARYLAGMLPKDLFFQIKSFLTFFFSSVVESVKIFTANREKINTNKLE